MILTKPLLIITSISLLALAGSGYYIKTLLSDNAVLQADNKAKVQQIVSMEERLLSQKERFERTLKTLELREEKIQQIEITNSDLKKELNGIAKNEDDKCINTDHSPSISDLLRNKDRVLRQTSPSVPTRATPQEL